MCGADTWYHTQVQSVSNRKSIVMNRSTGATPAKGHKVANEATEGHHYVAVLRGEKIGYLAGPFTSKAEALMKVEPSRVLANELDPQSFFDTFGVVSLPRSFNFPGVLNDMLSLRSVEATTTVH